MSAIVTTGLDWRHYCFSLCVCQCVRLCEHNILKIAIEFAALMPWDKDEPIRFLSQKIEGHGHVLTKCGQTFYFWGHFVTGELQMMTVWIELDLLLAVLQGWAKLGQRSKVKVTTTPNVIRKAEAYAVMAPSQIFSARFIFTCTLQVAFVPVVQASCTVVRCEIKLFWNNFEIISAFYFTYNHHSILFQCFISPVTTPETEIELFQPLKEF